MTSTNAILSPIKSFEKKFGQMVALKGNEIVNIPIEVAVGALKTVDAPFYDMAKMFFG